MIQAANPPGRGSSPEPLFPDPVFRLRIEGEIREVTYPEAFAHGHHLIVAKRYDQAARIFERLTEVTTRGPRAHVMLALCRAGMSDYDGSRRSLREGFPEHRPLATAIQDAIVMARTGLQANAIQDLLKLVNEFPELPSLCLVLGDLLAGRQRLKDAAQCWKLAIARDLPRGGVGLAARQQLAAAAQQAAPPAQRGDE